MSGRLVILPHKSWHVWNQDNREKVKRDERLHREAQAAEELKQRKVFQQQQLDAMRRLSEPPSSGPGESEQISSEHYDSTLNTRGGVKSEHSPELELSEDPISPQELGYGLSLPILNAADDPRGSTSSSIVPFRLFEEAEMNASKDSFNEEYRREAAKKLMDQKRREGSAPWKLGDGSMEMAGVKPWYMKTEVKPSTIDYSTALPSGNSSSTLPERVRARLESLDPAKAFCKIQPPSSSPHYEDNSLAESKVDDVRHQHENDKKAKKEKATKKKTKHRKEKSRSKSKSKSKSKKSSRDESLSVSSSSSRESEGDGGGGSGEGESRKRVRVSGDGLDVYSAAGPDDEFMQSLRAKRLERERTERKRAASLLAMADIYGTGPSSSSSSSSLTYSQQYNPKYSRN